MSENRFDEPAEGRESAEGVQPDLDAAPSSPETAQAIHPLQDSLDTVSQLVDEVDPSGPGPNHIRTIDGVEYEIHTYWPQGTQTFDNLGVGATDILVATDGSRQYWVELQREEAPGASTTVSARLHETFGLAFDTQGNLTDYNYHRRAMDMGGPASAPELERTLLDPDEKSAFADITSELSVLSDEERAAFDEIAQSAAPAPEETQAQLARLLANMEQELRSNQDHSS